MDSGGVFGIDHSRVQGFSDLAGKTRIEYDDQQLCAIRRYIMNNPIKWELDRDNLKNRGNLPPFEKAEQYLEDLKEFMAE